MIRSYIADDCQQVMDIWLNSTISGHPFIDASYWYQVKPLVVETYLPNSQTFVYLQQNEIVGFISILESNLIGALFVKQDQQGKGIGKALIDYVKARYPLLLLEVYKDNKPAYQFYQNRGFTKVSENFNDETKAMVATMCYQAKYPITS